jgi:phosphoribosylformylglycinamidine cyclo-ligase
VKELGRTVGEALLEPTRIYAKTVDRLMKTLGPGLHALCHVTGGGITGNLPRALMSGQFARVDADYARGAIFELIREHGPVEVAEMRRTFNLGVGLVAVVDEAEVTRALDCAAQCEEEAWLLGSVEATSEAEPFVVYE